MIYLVYLVDPDRRKGYIVINLRCTRTNLRNKSGYFAKLMYKLVQLHKNREYDGSNLVLV